MADAATVRKAQTAGLITGGVLLVGAIITLLWIAREGIGDLFGGLGKVGSDAAKAATDVTGAVTDVTGAAGGTIAVLTAPYRPAEAATVVKPGDYQDGQPNLHLALLAHKNSRGPWSGVGRAKVNTTHLRVTSNGSPVPGATVHQMFAHPTAHATFGRKSQPWTTDPRGEVKVRWSIGDVPFTDAEDDAAYRATKKGYNPSNVVHTK